MSAADQDLFGTMLKVENKDLFVDLKRNGNGMYLKLSERIGKSRNTVLIPASGIGRLKSILEEILVISASNSSISPERKSRIEEDPGLLGRSVYVSGLAWTTTSDSLSAHFSTAGRVDRAVVLTKSRNGKMLSLGCGVVEFHSPEEATSAIASMNNSILDGRAIRCREDRSWEKDPTATPPSSHHSASPHITSSRPTKSDVPTTHNTTLDPTRVFITSLPWNYTSQDLTEIVRVVGSVVSIEMISTRKGRSLGHAIVEYSEATAADRAIAELNGHAIGERCMVVRPYYIN